MFSELLGGVGGTCSIRCANFVATEDPKLCGFSYHDCDSCWRCDGATTIGEVSFAKVGQHFMLPPFALDNNEWHLSPDWVESLPVVVTVAGEQFSLAGVVLSSPGHFTALILLENQWHFYDGLHGPGLLQPIDVLEIRKLKSFLCYAYYLIS